MASKQEKQATHPLLGFYLITGVMLSQQDFNALFLQK